MEPEAARSHLEAAHDLFLRSGRRIGEGRTCSMLGLTCALGGEPERGQEFLERALAIHAAEGYGWGEGQAHVYAGILAESIGADAQRITSHYRKAIDLLRPYRDVTMSRCCPGR